MAYWYREARVSTLRRAVFDETDVFPGWALDPDFVMAIVDQ
jgi:hypothetical protein